MLIRFCLAPVLLAFNSVMAQDAVEIRITEVVHDGAQLEVTVEKMSGGSLRYTLQYSPDLSAGSWVANESATLTVLDPSR